MKQNNLKSCIRKFTPQKRRAVAEVISSLLLVVITVVGAVILTTFLDESFVSGGLAAAGSDNSLKAVKVIAYDTRDNDELMDATFNLDHGDGMFSILPLDSGGIQNQDNQINGGQTVNLVVKLDSDNPDIPLSKTIRVQLNIGTNTLQEFLIESGGAQ